MLLAKKSQTPEQERARTQALFSSLGDGVIATDESGNISEINSAAVRILGYHAEELLGKWFPKAVLAVNEQGVETDLMDRPVIQAMISGKPIASKTFYLTKSRKQIPVAVTVSPIMLNDRPVGAIEIFRDISQEYEVDQMKSEFISLASHQLRTPLTAIKTYSHMLATGFSGELTKSQQDFMDIILGSIDRMNELINTLLDISRIEEGRLMITQRTIKLKEIMQEIVTELKPAAKAKQIKLEFHANTDDSSALTDPLLVKEVCANLLSNAIKYTPDKGSVTVSLAAADKHFIIKIRDTGYGIPKSEQKRVFSKFFRAENILNKDTSGTGLGLYLVKQIAENLGGDISFKSAESKGSEFTFSLPKT